jgi:propanol-preferring alcohol dehydrogenase
MRAAVLEQVGRPLVMRDVPTPRPDPGEVLVRIHASGVCHTDLKIIEGLAPALPLIPGHEPVGEIVELGEGVTGLAIGARVAVHPFFSCGECPACGRGEQEACVRSFIALAGLGRPGGYAEYMCVPADHVVALPDELSYAEAAPLLCAGLTTYAAFRNGNLQPGQRVVVVGIGGLGHVAISIAAALGATVYAVTTSPDKAADAERFGATFAGAMPAVLERLSADGGADLVLNTVDDLGPVAQLVPAMAMQGTIVFAAGAGDTLPVTPGLLVGLQLRLIGTFFGSATDLRELLDLAVAHQIRPQIERFALAEVNTAHDRLRANSVRYRAVLEL